MAVSFGCVRFQTVSIHNHICLSKYCPFHVILLLLLTKDAPLEYKVDFLWTLTLLCKDRSILYLHHFKLSQVISVEALVHILQDLHRFNGISVKLVADIRLQIERQYCQQLSHSVFLSH